MCLQRARGTIAELEEFFNLHVPHFLHSYCPPNRSFSELHTQKFLSGKEIYAKLKLREARLLELEGIRCVSPA